MEPPSTSLAVLYIEDDERLAQLTAKYLESHGVRVTLVSDGQAGIREALRIRPDVILLDLMSPDSTGAKCANGCAPASIRPSSW
jgi:DNA-binding response OmpR family regulator